MTIQIRRGGTPQNLNDGPIPPNSVLHRVLTLLAAAVAKRIRDKTLDDENSVETNNQGRFEPIHYEKEARKSTPS